MVKCKSTAKEIYFNSHTVGFRLQTQMLECTTLHASRIDSGSERFKNNASLNFGLDNCQLGDALSVKCWLNPQFCCAKSPLCPRVLGNRISID